MFSCGGAFSDSAAAVASVVVALAVRLVLSVEALATSLLPPHDASTTMENMIGNNFMILRLGWEKYNKQAKSRNEREEEARGIVAGNEKRLYSVESASFR